jgi:hypothetical protein
MWGSMSLYPITTSSTLYVGIFYWRFGLVVSTRWYHQKPTKQCVSIWVGGLQRIIEFTLELRFAKTLYWPVVRFDVCHTKSPTFDVGEILQGLNFITFECIVIVSQNLLLPPPTLNALRIQPKLNILSVRQNRQSESVRLYSQSRSVTWRVSDFLSSNFHFWLPQATQTTNIPSQTTQDHY